MFACLEAYLKIVRGALKKFFPDGREKGTGSIENHCDFSIAAPDITKFSGRERRSMFAAFDLPSDANLVLDHNLSVRHANERAVSYLELESYCDPNGTLFQTFDPSGPKNVDTENCMENSELESGLCRWKTSSGRVRDDKFYHRPGPDRYFRKYAERLCIRTHRYR